MDVSDAPVEHKDLRAYLRPVLKRWWLFVLIVPVVTAGTYLYYDHKPKTYEASAELYIQPSPVRGLIFGSKGESSAGVENLALLIQTSEVGLAAEKRLVKEGNKQGKGVPSGGISAYPIEKSNFIGITAASGSPDGAARLANAYAAAFVGLQRGQARDEAKQTAAALEKQLKQLETRLEEGVGRQEQLEQAHRREGLEQQIQSLLLLANQSGASGIKQVERAFPPVEATEHDPKGNAIFAFVVGLLLASAAAYLLEYLNRRINRIEDVEEIYRLPVLAEIPRVAKPAPREQSGVTMPKQLHGPFHRLQAKLELLGRERPIRTILVASAAPGEGKSVVARNLALAYREAGRNVAVVDADFRKASLGQLLDAEEGLGLSDILAGRASFGQVVQEVQVQRETYGNGNGNWAGYQVLEPGHQRTDGELAMVPAGEVHGNLATAFASEEMRSTLQSAADAYGVVIVDSPPLLAVADALPLLSEADAVVIVTRLGVSTRDSARRLIGELERVADVNVAGVVINGISPRVVKARSYGYYDG